MSWFLWQKKLVIVCYQLLTLPLEYLIQGWVVLDYEIQSMCLWTAAYNDWTFEQIKKLGGQRFGPTLPENKVSSFLLMTEKLVWNVPSMCLFHSQNSRESMTKWFGQWTWNLAIASSSGALTDTWIRSRFLVQLLYLTCTWPSVCFLICWVHLRSWLLWDDFRGVWGN